MSVLVYLETILIADKFSALIGKYSLIFKLYFKNKYVIVYLQGIWIIQFKVFLIFQNVFKKILVLLISRFL